MRTVDFSPLPDHAKHRAELDRALASIDLGGAQRTDPIDDAAAFGLGYPQELSDDDLRERAEAVREQLQAQLTGDTAVRFQLADPEAGTEGGAPTHLA